MYAFRSTAKSDCFTPRSLPCRLSASDEYQTPKSILEKLKLHTIDWAFSYIVSEKTDINKLIEIINFANDNDNFTHIRLVNDIINHNDNAFGYIKKNLDGLGINQSKLIYQETEEFKHGTKRCLSSLLTPVISPDGAMMPCCGITYATFPPALDWPKELSMGTDIEEIYKNQIYFNGSICKKCYQYARNDMLNMLWELKKINHKEFI